MTILQHWFTKRALDGASVHIGHPDQFRRFTGEVVPILQERGLFRAEYEAGTLRGNLGLPIPQNRYTAARQAAARGSAALTQIGTIELLIAYRKAFAAGPFR
jgi:hypothetical protein